MIKTKLFGVNALTKGKDIDTIINEWIEQNAGIKVIDIKFQTHYVQTDRKTITGIYDALVMYEDHGFVDYIMKKEHEEAKKMQQEGKKQSDLLYKVKKNAD